MKESRSILEQKRRLSSGGQTRFRPMLEGEIRSVSNRLFFGVEIDFFIGMHDSCSHIF